MIFSFSPYPAWYTCKETESVCHLSSEGIAWRSSGFTSTALCHESSDGQRNNCHGWEETWCHSTVMQFADRKLVILHKGFPQNLLGNEWKRQPGKMVKSSELKKHGGEMICTLLTKCWCIPYQFWKLSLTPLSHIVAWNSIVFFHNMVSLISLHLCLLGASLKPFLVSPFHSACLMAFSACFWPRFH